MTPGTPVTPPDDDARLRADSAQIEHMLAELRELVVPAAWQRIEQVLRAVVGIYGAGLGRALAHARATGADPAALDRRLCDDELVASLLVLHGLHPEPIEHRIARALDAVRGELGLDAGALELVAIEDGTARLRATAPLGGGAMAARVAEGVIRRVLEIAAPELAAIEIAAPAAAPEPGLVQIRTRKEAR